MAIYAIGDIQGCYQSLMRLLEKLDFDEQRDTLWFCGDLVNRGPDSLAALRFVKSLQEQGRAITVLGNHDLFLLALAEGHDKNKKHSLDDVLNAPDSEELLHWLRHQPLLHHDSEHQATLVHAGIYPAWDLATAKQLAGEAEQVLQSPQYREFFAHMFGNTPKNWDEKHQSWDRIRFIINAFTRMRYLHNDGSMDFHAKGSPGSQEAGLVPWYELSERLMQQQDIIFGHWSTLGGKTTWPHVYALDTGCLWGGSLTALQVDKRERPLTSYNCEASKVPHKR